MPAVAVILAATGATSAIGATVGAAIVGSAVSATTALVIGSATVAAGMALAQGGDASDALQAAVVGGITAGVGSGISSAVTSSLVDAGVNSAVASTAGNAIAGGTTSALRGGDFGEGALAAGLNTGFNKATDALATFANTPTMDTTDLNYTPSGSIAQNNPYLTEDIGGLPSLDTSNLDSTFDNFSLTGGSSNIPNGGVGLNPEGAYNGLSMDSVTGQAPNYVKFGGGSGLTADASSPLGDPKSFINNPDNVSGALGTVSSAGFTDQNATPALGNPGSMINNPNVTGQPVIGTPACNYNVNVPNVKISSLLNKGSSSPNGNENYATTNNSALFKELNPWLDSSAEMLNNQLKFDIYGRPIKTSAADPKTKKLNAVGQADTCLIYGGVPETNISALTSLGGSFENASGYAEGGCVMGCKYCTVSSYMPKFAACGPDTLQTTPSAKRQQIGLKQLQHMQQRISNMGNMGGMAKGGLPQKYQDAMPEGHNPEFVTGLTGYYACGGGTGQSDDIPAMLHDGDYVMDADVVASLGDGSSKAGREILEGFRNQVPHKETAKGKPVPAKIADGEYVFPEGFVTAIGGGDNKAGAKILDGLREKLRAHKRSAPTSKIPPKAKSPLDYIQEAKG